METLRVVAVTRNEAFDWILLRSCKIKEMSEFLQIARACLRLVGGAGRAESNKQIFHWSRLPREPRLITAGCTSSHSAHQKPIKPADPAAYWLLNFDPRQRLIVDLAWFPQEPCIAHTLAKGTWKQGNTVIVDLFNTNQRDYEDNPELRTHSFTCCLTYLDSVLDLTV